MALSVPTRESRSLYAVPATIGAWRLHLLLLTMGPVSRSVYRALREDGHRVIIAPAGPHAYAEAVHGRLDAIVVDLTSSTISGAPICYAARAVGVRAPLLVLTGPGTSREIAASLDAGADDHLAAPFENAELLIRLKALSRRAGQRFRQTTDLLVGDLLLDLTRSEAQRAGRSIVLSGEEFALLETLMRRPGHAFRQDELIDRAWGSALAATSMTTFEGTMLGLREKIDSGSWQPLIRCLPGARFAIEASC